MEPRLPPRGRRCPALGAAAARARLRGDLAARLPGGADGDRVVGARHRPRDDGHRLLDRGSRRRHRRDRRRLRNAPVPRGADGGPAGAPTPLSPWPLWSDVGPILTWIGGIAGLVGGAWLALATFSPITVAAPMEFLCGVGLIAGGSGGGAIGHAVGRSVA